MLAESYLANQQTQNAERRLATMGLRWYQGVSRGQWMALAAALLGWMFDGFEQGIFPLVGRPALVEVLNLSELAERAARAPNTAAGKEAAKQVDAQVGPWYGAITAAFLVGAALGGWGFGWLGDRIGRVRAMVFSVLTYALFTGLCGLAQSPEQLAGLRFLSALGMGGEWALGVALVMESWRPGARPVLAGLIGAAANVGFMLTGFVGMGIEAAGLPVAEGGWRWILGICAFPALLTFFIRMFVPESERWQLAVKTAPRTKLTDIFAAAIRRRTLVGAFLGGIALLGTWGSVQWILPWVKTSNDQHTVNIVQICSAFGAILGSFSGAVLGNQVRRRWAYFTLCAGSLLGCAVLFRGFPESGSVGWQFLLTVTLVGGFTASFYGWLPLYLPELFPTRVRATGQGFSYNAGRIFAAGGVLSMGFLMSEQVFNGSYPQAGATISLIYAVGLFAIWLAPETRGQPLPE
jgi:MFS family permease